jgi:hypothetical protein
VNERKCHVRPSTDANRGRIDPGCGPRVRWLQRGRQRIEPAIDPSISSSIGVGRNGDARGHDRTDGFAIG